MKQKIYQKTERKTVQTKYIIYHSYRYPLIIRIFIENIYYPLIFPKSRFLIITKGGNTPSLGHQQVIKIDSTTRPSLIQKIISDRIFQQNLYYYSYSKKRPYSLLIFILLAIPILLKILPSHPFPLLDKVKNETDSIIIFPYLISDHNISKLESQLNISTESASIIYSFENSKHKSDYFEFFIPSEFLISDIAIDHQPLPRQNFAQYDQKLIVDPVVDGKTITLTFSYKNRFGASETLSFPRFKTILSIVYPINYQISFDKAPVFAQPGLVRYNLPINGSYELTIFKHD